VFTAIPPGEVQRVLKLEKADLVTADQSQRNPEAIRRIIEQKSDPFQVRMYSLKRGEVWRLVSPVFVHFGPWHLALNLFALYQLGRVLEMRYGTLRLGLIMLVIAAVSNFLQATMPVRWDGSPVMMVPPDGWGLSLFGGISGVVFGLLGFAWIKSRQDWSAGFYVPRATMVWAIAWILLGVSELDERLLGANMANWAHGAGFVLGIMLGYLSTMFSSAHQSKGS
jgi:GlpG protein